MASLPQDSTRYLADWKVLEENCRMIVNDETLFSGPRRYIQDLRVVVELQKAYIHQLECQLIRVGIQPMQLLQHKGQEQQVP